MGPITEKLLLYETPESMLLIFNKSRWIMRVLIKYEILLFYVD